MPPNITWSNPTAPIAHVSGAFSEAELNAIQQYADRLLLADAKITNRLVADQAAPDEQYSGVRITKLAEIHMNPATSWIYQRLGQVVVALNQRYRFDLNGNFQALQYLVYRDSEGGHFDWHIDPVPLVNRKISLTLQLSDASDYEGCELQFDTAKKIATAPKTRGALVAFPSHLRHRVSPITKGTRKSIVAWAIGR